MNRAVLALALYLLAASPAPATLVAGSVRDQHGSPIAGASVSIPGSATHATTQADGTFVLYGGGTVVEIRCGYCRTQRAAVGADGTVVAIVQRYDAVRLRDPSSDDLAHLPYARVESSLALAPFVVLTQSSGPIPGAFLHDASLSTPGGLLVLNGVPDYDSTGGISTFGTIPAQASTSATVTRTGEAYTYGDLGVSGIFNVDTTGAGNAIEGGSDIGVRASADSPDVQSAAAYSNWDQGDRRDRAAAQIDFSSGQTQGQLSLDAGSSNDSAIDSSTLGSSFSSLRFSLERTQGIDSYASIFADRGTNGYASTMYPLDETWSDAGATVGVRSDATVAPFAEFSTSDTHDWMSSPLAAPYVAGQIDQARTLTGLNASAPWYTATAAIGFDQIGYNGIYPDRYSYSELGRDETLSFDLHPAGGWTLNGNTTSGYAISPLFDSYQSESTVPVLFENQNRIAFGYGDERRVRVEALAVQTRSDSGINDVGNGFDVAWQIAPSLSLRTWWLNLKPATGSSQQVGSAWATFTPGAIRLDVIWQRNLLNGLPNAHVDAAISGPLSGSFGWFVRTEQRLKVRATDAGVTL